MDTLSKLLANRRLPGEHISKRLEAMHVAQARLEDPTLEEVCMHLLCRSYQIPTLWRVEYTVCILFYYINNLYTKYIYMYENNII